MFASFFYVETKGFSPRAIADSQQYLQQIFADINVRSRFKEQEGRA